MKNDHAYNSISEGSTEVRPRPQRWLAYLCPPLLAVTAVWNEPTLTTLARTHEAILPLAILLLLAALLQQELRQYLVVTLCYGVAFLAVRDTSRVMQAPLPAALNYDWVDALRPISLWSVALLAATSGVAETVKPGTVWARRCYFAAASLYFTGIGVMNYAANHSWRGLVLCITGVTALIGCILAHHVVAAEVAVEDELPSDEQAQQARDARHIARLKAREWRGNIMSIIEERDAPVTGAAVDGPQT
jgi:hypothetical protein